MVRDTISETDQDLQNELVYICSTFGDIAEAAKWAHHFQLKPSELPLTVQEFINKRCGFV